MDFLSKILADIILFIGKQTHSFWDNLVILNFSLPQIILDIALVTLIVYFILSQLKGTRTVHIVIGLSVIGIMYTVSKAFQLVALAWLLERFTTVVLVAIPVIFQQEIRSGLERIGHTKIVLKQQAKALDEMIEQVVEACISIVKSKEGALIVFQQDVPLKEYVETGIPMNALMSKELLIAIFNHKTSLHDGAVIIDKQNILAASCLLPHTLNPETGMGTRHKAALGVSENSDAVIVVVSEEKGTVSFVKDGEIQKNVTPEKLKKLLKENLKIHK